MHILRWTKQQNYALFSAINTNNILEGMNGLVSVVTNLLSKVNEVLDTGKNAVKGIVKAIGGLS